MPLVAKKPFETVYELKDEYKVPSFEEFMKTYESDDKIINSYEDEFNSQVVQGSQYGPGKSDFPYLYRKAKRELGFGTYERPTCKISCDSDYFYSWKNYTGAIIYAINGKFKWINEFGEACGRRGQSFYVVVKCTEGWPTDAPETGVVHARLIDKALGINIRDSNHKGTVCCTGFAYLPNDSTRSEALSFNSKPLNAENQIPLGGETNGYRRASEWEEALVRHCWEEYKSKSSSCSFTEAFRVSEKINDKLKN